MSASVTVRVVADLGACQGYANCLVTAPEAFDLSEEGKVIVLHENLAALDQVLLADAVNSCPAAALRIEPISGTNA